MLLADRTPQDLTSIRHRKMMGRRVITTAARLRHFSPFCLWFKGFLQTKHDFCVCVPPGRETSVCPAGTGSTRSPQVRPYDARHAVVASRRSTVRDRSATKPFMGRCSACRTFGLLVPSIRSRLAYAPPRRQAPLRSRRRHRTPLGTPPRPCVPTPRVAVQRLWAGVRRVGHGRRLP